MAGAGLSSSNTTSSALQTQVGVTVTGPGLTFNETGGDGGGAPWAQPVAAPAVSYSKFGLVVTTIGAVVVALLGYLGYKALSKKKGA